MREYETFRRCSLFQIAFKFSKTWPQKQFLKLYFTIILQLLTKKWADGVDLIRRMDLAFSVQMTTETADEAWPCDHDRITRLERCAVCYENSRGCGEQTLSLQGRPFRVHRCQRKSVTPSCLLAYFFYRYIPLVKSYRNALRNQCIQREYREKEVLCKSTLLIFMLE